MRVTTDPATKPDVVIRLTWDEARHVLAITERAMDRPDISGSLAYDIARALVNIGVSA